MDALQKLATSLGLDTSDLEARNTVVTGVYLGRTATMTKPTEAHPEPRPMWVLRFYCADKSVALVNMLKGANDERLHFGETYTAGWVGNKFTLVRGAGTPVGDGDVVL